MLVPHKPYQVEIEMFFFSSYVIWTNKLASINSLILYGPDCLSADATR